MRLTITMMRGRATVIGVVVFLRSGCYLAGLARADETDLQAAREEFKAGFALQEQGKCMEAIAHYRESYKLRPAPTTLLHVARCMRTLHHLDDASKVYSGILRLHIDSSAPEEFQRAQRQALGELHEVEEQQKNEQRDSEERGEEGVIVRRGFYLQAAPVGFEYLCFQGACAALYHFDFELGGHFSNDDKEKGTRHYGWVVAVRQSFGQAAGTIARTQARVGYDFGVPIGERHQLELTLGLYAAEGFAFVSSSGGSAFATATSLGIEGKFFFFKGLYALFRPLDAGVIAADNVSAFVGTFLATGIGWSPVE